MKTAHTNAEHLEARLEDLRKSAAFRNYETARQHVLQILDNAGRAESNADPSEYWSEELRNIDYMFDASPLVVERLRQHTYHITGIWSYNYRSHRDRQQAQHAAKLAALLEVGDRDLFVPESPLLGGFGFELELGLANIDTLKFFEVLIALDRAEVLRDFRCSECRQTVWEIGAGWGGLAYVFKTLFPDTTYVISDLPELFLYSATYLMTAFPEAKFTFHSGAESPLDEQDWNESDFVFIPAHATQAVNPPRIDLALNMVSFQEMTTAQVEAYVRHAYSRKVPFLYSLNRERSGYNPDLRGVSAIMAERYWLHEIELLSVTYQELPDVISPINRKRKKEQQQGKIASSRPENRYRHLIGWRRIAA